MSVNQVMYLTQCISPSTRTETGNVKDILSSDLPLDIFFPPEHPSITIKSNASKATEEEI